MNAVTKHPAHDWKMSPLLRRGALAFLLAHDLRRASLAINLSNRLKVKAVLHLPRLRQKPSSSAKPKETTKEEKVPKEEVKGKKDKSSVKSSAKSSAKAGEVSFDNDDAEEEDHDAEYDWDENEEYVAEEHPLAERAFATAYHSHVCEVCDPDDGELDAPMGDTETHGESQEIAPLEEHYWTTDEDAMDSAGLTRAPNSPVAHQDPVRTRVPSEQARNAAAAVMRTNFPRLGPIDRARPS